MYHISTSQVTNFICNFISTSYGDKFYLQHITSLLPKHLWQPILPTDTIRVVDSFETNEVGIGKNIT